MPRLATALALVLVAPACTTEETDPSIEFRSTTIPLNSPRANDFDMPELNLEGLENEDDVSVVGVWAPGNNFYALGVTTDHNLVALDAQGNTVLFGNDMIGTKIELSTPLGTEVLRVFDYQATVPSWANPGAYISTYALAYQDDISGRWKNVCPEYEHDPSATVVTIIGGETYNEATKVVEFDKDGWITLACEGQAVYKMKRLGYGPGMPFNGGGESTVDQRQATLRMITATYCAFDNENYNSYTFQNTAILWANWDGTVDEPGSKVEAKWGPDGALCLENTRIEESNPPCANVLPPCNQINSWEWETWVP